LKKVLITLLKIGISLAIVAWLVYDAARTQDASGQNIFQRLIDQPKHWGMLALAGTFCAAAVMLTLVRWWYLVRALDIPLSFPQSLRIGFLGYLFNLAPMGIVGGDLLKAWMLSGHQGHRGGERTKAFATVVVDRIIGLYSLFLLASVAILLTGFWRLPQADIRWVAAATFAVAGLFTLGVVAALSPALTESRAVGWLERLPKVGTVVETAVDAMRTYRGKPGVLVGSTAVSFVVHGMFATGIYFIARGLPGEDLSLSMHWVVAPLAASTGAIPLVMGPMEFVLEYLYTHVPEGVAIGAGQGLVVALCYRLITVLIAVVGFCYYLGSRREVSELMHEAEHEPAPPTPPSPGMQFAQGMEM